MNWRRTAAAVLAAGLLAAGCTSGASDGHGDIARQTAPGATQRHSAASGQPTPSTVPDGQPRQPPADFSDCRDRINLAALNIPADRAARLSFECAVISVPLDYAQPTGKTIDLQLLKIHDSAATDPIGSLLVNPGGPGGSGISWALSYIGQLPGRLLRHFDIVGFDPRGVGDSSPIRCLSDEQKDAINAASPNILTARGFAKAKKIAQQIARACSSKYGAALAEYNTVQTARDMDLIRQAVGDPKLNYLGFSYGTELGAQYLHLFPGKVRAAVLDGAVDPLTDDITSFANQLQGFELAFDQFESWCARQRECRELGDPRKLVGQIAATAGKAGIPSSAPGESRRATSSIVYTGVLSALYSKATWPQLAQALGQAASGDARGLFQLADAYNQRYNGHYTNISDANTTISCNDAEPGPSDATIRRTAKSWAERFPIFGLWAAPSLLTCQQWQPHRTVPPLPTAPNTANPVLVIGNLHDPATPYQGAKDLTKTLGNARLLSWDGEGHTSYLQGSSCIDDDVGDYLIDLTLPPRGKVCPP